MPEIHPTAIIGAGAELGDDVVIGPYCIVGDDVRVGAGTVLKSHVNLDGNTHLGERCTIWPFASIGTLTQDLKYKGGSPGVRIGDDTTLREYSTVNTATFDGDNTIVGSKCHIMAYAHVAHDCIVGDGVIMANAATLAGHVIVHDSAIIGGLVGVHQFARLGELSILGGCSKAVQDVPPFMMTDGNPLKVRGVNKVGLERRGEDEATVRSVVEMYKIIYRQNKTIKDAVEAIRDNVEPSDCRQTMLSFLEQDSNRGYTRS